MIKIPAEPGFEPRVAGWEEQTLPLCSGTPPNDTLTLLFQKYPSFSSAFWGTAAATRTRSNTSTSIARDQSDWQWGSSCQSENIPRWVLMMNWDWQENVIRRSNLGKIAWFQTGRILRMEKHFKEIIFFCFININWSYNSTDYNKNI